jgi:hypothetical protein
LMSSPSLSSSSSCVKTLLDSVAARLSHTHRYAVSHFTFLFLSLFVAVSLPCLLYHPLCLSHTHRYTVSHMR